MAQTDARAGFRLPWSSDRQQADTAQSAETAPETAEQPAATSGWPTDDGAHAPAGSGSTETDTETETSGDASTVDPWTGASTPPVDPVQTTEPVVVTMKAAAKKPSKFLADLTKAMQAAAEEARQRSVSQLQADAKSHIEAIHGRSSTEAATLRRKADDDVAAVREWSKAEIARIREETETKITARKALLETEIEQSAAVIEREIEAVQKTVADFEEEMAAFFERLLSEDDPTRFATMAENLPEPPSFEDIVATVVADEPTAEAVAVAEPETEAATSIDPEAVAATTDDAPEAVFETTADAETPADDADGTVETEATTDEVATGEAETTEPTESATADAGTDLTDGEAEAPAFGSVEGFEGDGEFDGEVDREAAFAAIQAAAEAAASAEVAADAAARAEAVADVAIEIIGNHDEEGETDPRFAALGLSGELDAAEAEAFAAAGTSDEEIPEVGEDALAARLAGLGANKKGDTEGATSTQVIVVGLVSVASIASFKRHLGRVPGVNSVGVSSGPDGEFVFAVSHGAEVVLRDVIPSLPSFQARVTSASDGVVNVTAHDPESDS